MKSMFQVLSCDLVGKLMLAVVGTLLIRYMSQADYAKYSVAYALMLVFVQICSGCLSRVYVIGFDRFNFAADPSVLARLQFALLCLGVPVLAVMLGAGTRLAWVCAAAMALGCATELTKSRFQQQMRFGKYSSVDFVRAMVVCLGAVAVVWLSGWHPTALLILAVQLLSFSVVLLLHGIPNLNWKQPGAFSATRAFASDLWNGPYRYLFVYFLILAFLNQIELFILRYAGTEHQLATYASAYRYYNVLLMALTAANAVLSPAAQRIRTQEHTMELRRQHGAALLLFLPVVAIAIAGAGFVIPAIDGGRYPESPAVFRILAISSLLSFAMSPALNLVLRYEDFRFLTAAAATACVLGPVLNLLLIPRFGAMGTAWSLLVSMTALNGAGFWRASRYRIGLGLAVAA